MKFVLARQESLVDVVPLDLARPVGQNIRVSLYEALQPSFQNVIRLSHLKNLAHLLKNVNEQRAKGCIYENDVPVEELLLALVCIFSCRSYTNGKL